MFRLQGRIRPYAWGSPEAIPGLFGYAPAEGPVAEVWFGAHPDCSALIGVGADAPLFEPAQLYPSRAGTEPVTPDAAGSVTGAALLIDYVAAHPTEALGGTVAAERGGALPYLLKLIAPAQPLSLQVHPSVAQAEAGFAREEAAGIPRTARERSYRDRNHKPELAFALAPFEALAGFRTVHRIAEILGTLHVPVADRLHGLLAEVGVAGIFRHLLSAATRPQASEIAQVVTACERRLARGDSPSPRADRIAIDIAGRYPNDPGVIASLLLNPVSLRPGEALFIPEGTVHAYLRGIAVEIMATSDNVLRAGLTAKHIDVPELLRIMDDSAAPPIRIAPERMSPEVSTFYAPVDEFELSSVVLTDATATVRLRSRGPRTLVCLEGATQVFAGGERVYLNAGQALFIPDADGVAALRGVARVVVATVP
ncbi:mannose-6-phosphate isomerase, class I [Neoactinobaculum massilliense]|uniref:mannose-6-phosphate isomerase, class I n=1 Tax=Neoactinobaculum massilliense TaxID=2364794 RepID=UPI000F53ABED|nr:mannose-6-phosphate isomerase, class I [Neoactinobaculum massilliense]